MIQASNSEPAESNGRRTDGKFGAGNSFGRGNPTARHAQRLRQLFVTAVTEQDITDIVTKLVELAKDGDIQAANLLLTRALGKPSTADTTLPIDSEPVTTIEQVKTIDDAREYSAHMHSEQSSEMIELKAQMYLRIGRLKNRESA